MEWFSSPTFGGTTRGLAIPSVCIWSFCIIEPTALDNLSSKDICCHYLYILHKPQNRFLQEVVCFEKSATFPSASAYMASAFSNRASFAPLLFASVEVNLLYRVLPPSSATSAVRFHTRLALRSALFHFGCCFTRFRQSLHEFSPVAASAGFFHAGLASAGFSLHAVSVAASCVALSSTLSVASVFSFN